MKIGQASGLSGYFHEERMSLLEQARQTLSIYNLRLRKSWGQNLLVNEAICEKIIQSANLSNEDVVLEIGPGLGVLTSKIAPLVSKLIAVEIDRGLVRALKEKLSSYENVSIIEADILKCDLKALLSSYNKVKVIANLPYYITTPVIIQLLTMKRYLSQLIIMVQKEVGERILARPGISSKRYGSLSVLVQFHTQAKLLMQISKGSFFPQPKVNSVVLSLTIRQTPAVAVANEELFFQLVRAGFGNRRKMLVNALVEAGMGKKDDLLRSLDGAGIAPQMRAEDLTMEDFARLNRTLSLTLPSSLSEEIYWE